MYKFSLKMKEFADIKIYTDLVSVKNKMLNSPQSLTKTIPVSVEFEGETDTIVEKSNYVMLLNYDKKYINTNKANNSACMMIEEKDLFFPDLVYLVIGLFANALQEKGMYFVQSSVVKYDDKHSIMILGDPNAGKTTLAYKLMKDNNFKLISNDNVLIGMEDNHLNTYTGTKMMQMRLGGIKLYFPELLSKIDYDDENRNEWDIKIYIDEIIKEQGLGYADNSIITDIYNVITFKSGDTFIRQREKIDEILLLYEHLTKQIRSNRYALTGFNYPLPSFEKEEYLQPRYEMAKQISDCTNVYDARGTVDEIAKKMVLNCAKR